MIVILAIAIIGGWILACIFRKRYLRKKELNYELRPPVTPWADGRGNSPYGGNGGGGGVDADKEANMMTSALPEESVKPKKKWTVSQRT
jgi:hypothetical protein